MIFVDRIQILVQAGNGGSGCESYYRRTDRKAVPHGGDGGNGGSVIFVADRQAPGLHIFRGKKKIMAEDGGNGGSTKKRGRTAEDLIVKVPVGTRIVDHERKLLIRQLAFHGDQVVVAKGGQGGLGNHHGRPSMPGSTPGQSGEILDIELTARIAADIFLVGLPNSGKSKLMNALTRAHIREEAYPFTTKTPELGVWEGPDGGPLSLCELPSLYRGSHEGRGAGADFLKHLEGGQRVLFVLDPISEFAGSLKEGFDILSAELRHYSEDFPAIPLAVIVTKTDLEEAKARIKKEKFKPGVPVFCISTVSGDKMKDLLKFLDKIQKETEFKS